ncbi:error-prone DNA polymerase [Stenotrophomonas acidaminiphila]|uniref:error-prone DNA polymerase n=1 Tax=Stenotrophomonas acidaminiphila TaxID=128780 RepID=UPI0028A8741E|nr:error-prone DNA polymerase [Stenotrophomonas acidaminiphila]
MSRREARDSHAGTRVPRAWEVAQRLGRVAANDGAPGEDALPAYAELHCLSDFSFLRGAASAEELFTRARDCGYEALAITDECSLAGIVRAWEAARASGVRLVVGSEFALACGLRCVLLVETADGYTRLCELISRGRLAAGKGTYRLARADVEAVLGGADAEASGLFALWLPGAEPQAEQGRWLRALFGARAHLAVELHREQDDAARLQQLLALADALAMTPLASGDVHMDVRRRRMLQDTMTAIRHNLPLAECGAHLFRNGERHLRTRRALGNIHPPALLQNAVRLARRCRFDLGQLQYRYPTELVPDGHTPGSWLRELTERGMRERWPEGVPPDVVRQIESELELIAYKQYEAFFLTVQDIVRFAKENGILCQGRGSSANSAVCFALGITVVDPAESRLLMARFLSRERDEPPDIDVDFEHERREEVLQYVYAKYGRHRAALAATVIRYRGRSAVRDVARAFGLPPDQIALLAGCHGWGNGEVPMAQRLRETGFDPDNPLIRRLMAITAQLNGHPRHLSQHVGGFVISDAPLSTVVPVENAAMDGRTIIQWDKDDLETMKLLKVDCLALGMLTCIRKALELVERHRGQRIDLARLPAGDEPTYAMIQAADTVGVFQIESRAQMSMLPRLKPACFYDLVIEVAIVRPGPIQGDMVHPYLRRRQGREEVTYPSDGIRDILKPTLGIPLFQEQVMELVIHAGYQEHEADHLRRSMAAWGRGGDMEPHREKIRALMKQKHYSDAFIEQIFEQIKGFGAYGFPQSHAASFAKLVYISSWLKRHEPAAFACALLNAQPMGFYSPSEIVQDARRTGRGGRRAVEVLPVDVTRSDWDNTLEGGRVRRSPGDDDGQPGIRLGLRQVAGLPQGAALAIVAARARRPFTDVRDLCLRAGLDERARRALAESGALQALAGHRHAARWEVAGIERQRPLLPGSPDEDAVSLPAPSAGEEALADYRVLGLTLGEHPLSLLRARLQRERVLDIAQVRQLPHGRGAHVAGIVVQRQRPGTAKGTVFVTLEDEHGPLNVVVWQALAARRRKVLLGARLMAVRGRWEQVDGVQHLVARDLHDLSHLLGDLRTQSRDFH